MKARRRLQLAFCLSRVFSFTPPLLARPGGLGIFVILIIAITPLAWIEAQDLVAALTTQSVNETPMDSASATPVSDAEQTARQEELEQSLTAPPRISETADAEAADGETVAPTSEVESDPLRQNFREPSEQQPRDASGTSGQIPLRLPDGRPVRAIALFHSQLAELVPQSYQPISMERFIGAIEIAKRLVPNQEACRVRNSLYVIELVDDTLVSNRSVLEIDADPVGLVSHNLGRVNMAITSAGIGGPRPASDQPIPRLESLSDGTLQAVVDGNANIEFAWSMKSETQGLVKSFDLAVPRSLQTRMVIQLPQNMTLETLDGALRQSPTPSPELENRSNSEVSRIYILDAGGLDRVRLRIRQRAPTTEPADLVVRSSFAQYDIDASRLRWTYRATLQLRLPARLPPLIVASSTVTSVRLDSVEMPFTTTDLQRQKLQRIEIDFAGFLQNSGSQTVALSLSGQSDWREDPSWCDLPLPFFLVSGLVSSAVTSNVQLTTVAPLRVIEWDLPEGWSLLSETATGEQTRTLIAQGPPVSIQQDAIEQLLAFEPKSDLALNGLPAPSPSAEQEPSNVSPWSRLRLASEPALREASNHLKIRLLDGTIEAKSQLRVRLDPLRIEPIRMRLQRGWTLESFSLPISGREIETPLIDTSTNDFWIWPEAADLFDAELVVQVVGQSRSRQTESQSIVPPTWLVQFVDVQSDLVAAVEPPSELGWSSETSLLSERITKNRLPKSFVDWLDSDNQQTLFLRCTIGRTPSLSLEPPSVALDVSSTYLFHLQGEEIVEDLIVEVSALNQSPQQITVQTGPAMNRPPFQWILRQLDGDAAISLPASDVRLQDAQSDGIYTIDVSQWNLRGQHLIGKRHYPYKDEISVRLPVIPNATSQLSEVLVAAPLIVKQVDPSVLRVPLEMGTSSWDILDIVPVPIPRPQAETTRSDSLPIDNHAYVKLSLSRLRYDAVDGSSILLAKSESQPNLNLVWSQEVTLVASNHGSDRVNAVFNATLTRPLRITYDSDLQLVAIEREGVSIEGMDLAQNPLTIEPGTSTTKETIRLVFSRQQYQPNWWRQCRVPQIDVSAEVVSREYFVRASSDSFAPATLWPDPSESSSQNLLSSTPGQLVWLVRRNNALAFGWLVAMIIFAISWMIAGRSLVVMTLLSLVLVVMILLWWPWKVIAVGWLLIPSVTASLLVSSLRWKSHKQQRISGSGEREKRDQDSGEFTNCSASTVIRGWGWFFVLASLSIACLLLVFCWGSATAGAQTVDTGISKPNAEATTEAAESPALPQTLQPIELLLPVDEKGRLVGDKLYVPAVLKTRLLAGAIASEPEEVRFQQASYRLRIESMDDATRTLSPVVEADFIVHVDRATDRIRLPIASTTIRRVELVQDDQNRIMQFTPTAENQVVVNVPFASRFRLRMTLIPEFKLRNSKGRLTMPLPPVAASRLTVEGSGNIDRVRVEGVTGKAESQRQLQIWTIDLGPIASLAVDIEFSKSTSLVSERPLRRRYWLHVGTQQTIVECQIEPTYSVSSGDVVSVLVRDSSLPTVLSSTWQIQQSDLLSPTRRQVTIAALVDNPGTIELLWTLNSRVNAAESGEDAVAMVIPNVVQSSSAEIDPAWIAINSAPEIGVSAVSREPLEALTDDQFLAAWTGYRAQKPDRTFVAIGQVPAFQLVRIPTKSSLTQQTHQVQIANDLLEIRYRAEIVEQSNVPERWILKVPAGASLRQLSIDGQSVPIRGVQTDGMTEVLLGDVWERSFASIEAVAAKPYEKDKPFGLPRLFLAGSGRTLDRYSITRDQSIEVQAVAEAPTLLTQVSTTEGPDHLTRGWVPIAAYEFDSDDVGNLDHVPGLRFKSSERATRFSVNQLIALSWVDGRWNMQTQIQFAAGTLPDYVDIQIPTRWCESLSVTPAARWSRQPADDMATQLIRVACDENIRQQRAIMISGTLLVSDKSRVSVPAVTVLGQGRRTISVSVPSRLTNEPIRWRSSSVRAAAIPAMWANDTELPSDQRIDLSGPRSNFAVVAPQWSIELAPLQQQNVVAKSLAADTRVYSGRERILVLTRWDLVPGTLDQIDIAMPNDATCLGVWTANQAVQPQERASTPSAESANANVIRVPLSLSRLSQSVELLMQVPLASASQGDYLPKLLQIPVSEHWLSLYSFQRQMDQPVKTSDQATNNLTDALQSASAALVRSDTAATELAEQTQRRAIALALSTSGLIETSSDILAERSTSEVSTWLRPIVARYEQLAAESGHQVDWNFVPSATERSKSSPTAEIDHRSKWDALNQQMLTHVQRYCCEEPVSDFRICSAANFAGYSLQWIERVTDNSLRRPVLLADESETNLRAVIVNATTMIAAFAIIAIFWPIRRYFEPIAVHPAFWLALVGFCGFFVAPIPVAASILLVSISLPAFTSKG